MFDNFYLLDFPLDGNEDGTIFASTDELEFDESGLELAADDGKFYRFIFKSIVQCKQHCGMFMC